VKFGLTLVLKTAESSLMSQRITERSPRPCFGLKWSWSPNKKNDFTFCWVTQWIENGWTTGKHMPLLPVVGGGLSNLTLNNWLIGVLHI